MVFIIVGKTKYLWLIMDIIPLANELIPCNNIPRGFSINPIPLPSLDPLLKRDSIEL